jgi:hypothetical protein
VHLEIEPLYDQCSRISVSVQLLSEQVSHVRPWRFMRRSLCLAFVVMLAASHFALGQNRVLDLDGNGSFVELPTDIFTNLTEATVEVWAKWDSFRNYSRVFDFGAVYQSMSIFNHGRTPDLRFNLYPQNAQRDPALLYHIRLNGLLKSHEWIHLAAVSGSGGMQLYVNGALAGTHTNAASFADIKVSHTNLFGRGVTRNPQDEDFHGQLDEIRVWDHRRTEAQIRENMRRQLTGNESGLAGLWNFDDGTARDSSSFAHDGKLAGNARVVTSAVAEATRLAAAEPPATIPAKPITPPAGAVAVVPANTRDAAAWWIAGALALIVGLLAYLVLMLRRSGLGAQKLLPVASPKALTDGEATLPTAAAASASELKERALAELTEFAKESLVQGLVSQRNLLLETHQKAQQELATLEARLVSLHLSDRVQAYERRIAELEKELDSRSGELRELTSATLLLLRRKLEEERQLERERNPLN